MACSFLLGRKWESMFLRYRQLLFHLYHGPWNRSLMMQLFGIKYTNLRILNIGDCAWALSPKHTLNSLKSWVQLATRPQKNRLRTPQRTQLKANQLEGECWDGEWQAQSVTQCNALRPLSILLLLFHPQLRRVRCHAPVLESSESRSFGHDVHDWAKEWALGCVNSPPPADRGSQEAGFMPPRAHSFVKPCNS